jgi:hypothetical protein
VVASAASLAVEAAIKGPRPEKISARGAQGRLEMLLLAARVWEAEAHEIDDGTRVRRVAAAALRGCAEEVRTILTTPVNGEG